MTRRVALTGHACTQAVARFPEISEFKQKFPSLWARALTACAGCAEQSVEEHYLIDSGFLKGKLKTPFSTRPVPVYFAYRIRPDGVYEIRTILDEAALAGDGARRHGG